MRRIRPRVIGATAAVLVTVPFGAGTAALTADTSSAPPPSSARSSWTAAGPVEVPRLASQPATPRRDPVWPARPVASPGVASPRAERSAVRMAPQRTPSTLPRSTPTRVRIPSIAVDSALVGLGLQDDGRMEVPRGAFPAGWYTGAPTPGQLGPAILAGHVDYGGAAGVFARLHELRPGDAVEVTRADGVPAVFRVTRVEQHAKDAFPTAAVYGDIDHAGLRLITCGGAFDRRARSYEDNLVVFAALDPGASVRG
ncbi:MAG: class F sortase [Actinobacteria bacterium]|nr:class F sortase [Actinomycetota bacterium]